MMMRMEFLIPDQDIRVYRYGEYIDMFHAYQFIYNFKAENLLYADAKKEAEEYRKMHRKIDSVFSI